jgi:hypothetical protein
MTTDTMPDCALAAEPRTASSPPTSAATEASPPVPFGSLAEGLLSRGARASWPDEARRVALGLGLAAIFGATIGLRAGSGGVLGNALGAALGFVAVAAVAVPSLAIVLALTNVPVDPPALARATTRAVAKAGLLLAGLAPAAALYAASVEDAITVKVVALGGLVLAGAIGMGSFRHDLDAPLRQEGSKPSAVQSFAIPAFLVFSAVLALRVWYLTLPVLTGAS